MESQMTTEYKHLHQIMYRKYFLITTGAILLLLIVVFCYDVFCAYTLSTYGRNVTYFRGS